MAFNIRGTSETLILDPQTLPYEITKLESVKIPMADGANLYAHIWIPKIALEGEKKLGTLVEYIPYRKNDNTAMRDAIRHPFYAGNGLCSIRIDMRGAGDSDDILHDEYLKQEQDDALSAFDWIVKQKWSNGNIAMFGKSWGGFNGLQVAARQHPALKTCISLMSTDDRYSDDVHYRGGCMLASDMLWWGSTMLTYAPRPQDPSVVGDSWKENWLKRLETPPMVKNWISHQTRDDYWKHGSICEDFSKVDIPILCVGGWRDGYTSPVFRMANNLPNPETSCLVGPWVHEYPEMAEPAPKIGYQQLSLAWFKKYLEPETKTDFKLPKFTAYVQDPCSIEDSYVRRPGKWVSLTDASSPKILKFSFDKNQSLTVKEGSTDLDYQFSGHLSHGLFRGTYCPFGFKGDFPADQKFEDSKCLTFDTETFEEDVDLLGEPILNITISSDKKLANCSARLVDIYPNDGEHVLISWGQLNLTHRNSHEFPEYLTPGEKYSIQIPLDVLGIKVAKGHKLRVALSTADWPQAWPTAETPILTLHEGSIDLPLIDESKVTKSPEFATPTRMPSMKTEVIVKHDRIKDVRYDYATDSWILKDIQDSGDLLLPDLGQMPPLNVSNCNTNIWKIKGNDPLSAENECSWTYSMGREGWTIDLDAKSKLTADKENFYLVNTLKAWHNKEEVCNKTWEDTIPRNFI